LTIIKANLTIIKDINNECIYYECKKINYYLIRGITRLSHQIVTVVILSTGRLNTKYDGRPAVRVGSKTGGWGGGPVEEVRVSVEGRQ